MIRFIDMNRDDFGVEAICRVMRETECGFITSRAYRAAKTRPASARALRDRSLIPEIERVHEQNYGVYGARKMWHAMRRAGWDLGRRAAPFAPNSTQPSAPKRSRANSKSSSSRHNGSRTSLKNEKPL